MITIVKSRSLVLVSHRSHQDFDLVFVFRMRVVKMYSIFLDIKKFVLIVCVYMFQIVISNECEWRQVG